MAWGEDADSAHARCSTKRHAKGGVLGGVQGGCWQARSKACRCREDDTSILCLLVWSNGTRGERGVGGSGVSMATCSLLVGGV
jgi:hypothetical protein